MYNDLRAGTKAGLRNNINTGTEEKRRIYSKHPFNSNILVQYFSSLIIENQRLVVYCSSLIVQVQMLI